MFRNTHSLGHVLNNNLRHLQKTRNDRRNARRTWLRVEMLEQREMLDAAGMIDVVFAPGTSPEYVADVESRSQAAAERDRKSVV